MSIFNIKNRTENWKTAETFVKLVANGDLEKFAEEIITNAGKTELSITDENVCLELFWKGFRDYKYQFTNGDKSKNKELKDKAIKAYKKHFNTLQKKIEDQKNRLKVCDYNYIVPEKPDYKEKLYQNLISTEIDIVISTPKYLLIGEAKLDEDFGSNSKHVLTHQLVREYVMATILTELIKDYNAVKIIPFVISNKDVKNCGQIKVMEKFYNLKKENVMLWNDVLSKKD